MRIHLQLDNTIYFINGCWEVKPAGVLSTDSDLSNLNLSLNNLATINEVNLLIHPDEIENLRKVLSAHKLNGTVNLRFKTIASDRRIDWVQGSGSVELSRDVKAVAESLKSKDLLQATLDSSLYVVQVFKAVRDKTGKIVDFTWLLTNKRWKDLYGSEMIGKSLINENPAVLTTGLFDSFVNVVETGITHEHEHYYPYEQFDAWFHQVDSKLDDGFVMNAIEITRRKKAEQEILRLKDEIALSVADKYLRLFNSIVQGFCIIEVIFDVQGVPCDYRFLEVNPAFEKQTGFSNAIGKTVKEFARKHEDFWFQTYGEVARTRMPVQFEHFASQLAGGVWYEVYAFPIGNKENEVGVLFNDITKRKKMEVRQTFLLKLMDSLRSTMVPWKIQKMAARSLAEHLNLAKAYYIEVHSDGNTVSIMAGYSADHPLQLPAGAKISDFGKAFLPLYAEGKPACFADVETDPFFGDDDRRSFQSIDIRSFIAVPILKDGKLIALLAVGNADVRTWQKDEVDLVEDVALRTWTVFERAKAEQHLMISEQRFRTIAEAAPALVWVCAPSGDNIFFSAKWYEFTGQSIREAAGDGWRKAIHPDDWKRIAPYWERCQRTGEIYQGEIRYHRHDGDWRWFNFRALPLYDASGDIESWYGISIEIHDQKIAQEALRELNARLQETDKAKTAFFNNVSHEFRTPLTLLIGPLEELIKSGGSKLTTDDMQKLQFAYRSATRLQKLVTTLLDFARIEAGKLEAYYQPADFSKITTELASNFRSAIEKAGLKYIVKVEQIAEPIYLNLEMWEKIVFNLLSNAFKFTHKGKIEVIIREKKKNAELRVKDTGVGIDAKDIDRIFDRFTRIEGTHARTQEGTGIGLALIRELVKAHGGFIKVKSVKGAGSEFTVSIPKGKAHFAKHQIFETRERQQGQDLKESFAGEVLGWLPEDVKVSRRNLKRYQKEGASRILVVEDNADMREYLSTVLSEDDHKIYAMEDGQKLITFLEEGGEADLIVADVMMPVLDGFEMVKKLKSKPMFAHIPIILLTAKTSEDSKLEGLRIGADAYLTKPFSAKELRAVVLASIRRAQKGKDG